MSDVTAAEEKISLSRTIVRYKGPYYSIAMSGLVFMPMPGIKTMCLTSSLVLGYDPEWAMIAKAPVLAADVAHELNHFLRRHLDRIPNGDPHLKNLAGDFSINPDLVDAGWELADETTPCPAIFPKHYGLPDGLSMEEYYALLLKAEQSKSAMNKALKNLLEEVRDGAGGAARGACGGIAHGGQGLTKIEQELAALPGAGRSKAEIRSVELRADKQIQDYVKQRGRGTVPSALVHDIALRESISRVRWQDVLARVVRTATGQLTMGDMETSFSRPSRRSYASSDVLRPSSFTRLPEIAIVRDTSGSMGEDQLSNCVQESYAILKDLGIDDVWFTDADAAVAMPWKRVNKEFFKSLSTARGGGGTRFGPAIKDALRLHPRPDLLIYCTDGDGDAGPPPPGMAVIFAVVPSYYNKAPCDWATTVFIEDPEESTS